MDFYLAQITLYAGRFVPRGWLACQGQLLSVAKYQALYTLLGFEFGGDGVNTFALPMLPPPAGVPPGAELPRFIICVEGAYPQQSDE